MFHLGGYAWLIALSACLAGCTARAGDAPTTRPAVVVELFTSEGCSSCPPADVLLAELAKPGAVDGVDVIPLAMHVDYWNRLGWADRFSSPQFSARQQEYARLFNTDQIYTPQMIVDGTDAFVGSDRQRANAVIAQAAAKPKGRVDIGVTQGSPDGRTITCTIAVTNLGRLERAADVMLAVTEDDLSTAVPRGENAGHTLHHTAIVRTLQRAATIRPADASPFAASTKIALDAAWNVDHLHVVVFVQDAASGKILAAGLQTVAAR